MEMDQAAAALGRLLGDQWLRIDNRLPDRVLFYNDAEERISCFRVDGVKIVCGTSDMMIRSEGDDHMMSMRLEGQAHDPFKPCPSIEAAVGAFIASLRSANIILSRKRRAH